MSIVNAYGYNSVTSNAWGLDVNLAEGKASKSQTNAAGQNKLANAYTNSYASLGSLSGSLNSIISEMGSSSNSKVTFQTLLDYRDQLQEDFTDKLTAGLTEAGIDPSVNFRLMSNADGSGVKVITDHADKAKIEKYFKDNPDMVTKFEKLQTLNQLEEARQASNVDPKAIADRIRLESMTAWYAGNGSDSFMSYADQNASFYSCVNLIA